MNRSLKIFRRIAISGCATLLVVIIIVVCFLLYKCSHPDYVERYDKPLSYYQAVEKEDIKFPLPASSSDIYFGSYADWQAYTCIVRFKAPVEDCLRHVDKVIAWNDANYHRKSSYPRVAVTSVAHQGAGLLDTADWFTPETIKNGLYVGEDSSHVPQIWIDLEKGIFYYKESD